MGSIDKNLAEINTAISNAAVKSGRTRDDIQLVAVTKTVEPERIRKLIEAGANCLGENRVQEFLPKYDVVKEPLMPLWHFIGHLQRNKVKYIIDKVKMIHSIDSIALAQEVDKRAMQANLVMDILIEINIAGEDSKHGITSFQAVSFVKELCTFEHLRVKGLMCIAPFVENPEDNRFHFRKMCDLLLDINAGCPHNMHLTELSMGMSGDYEVAIEEGATMVRIGSALVG